jgi:hypothetical protein
MAQKWVEDHQNARGGDQEKIETLMSELLDCNMEVVLELQKAAE